MESLFVQTENQRAIVETVARFVKEEVAPRAAALDAEPDPAKCYSWDIVEKAHALGIRTMTLDEKWGGLGADPLTTAMVIEELSKGDLGVGTPADLEARADSRVPTEQKARVLPGSRRTGAVLATAATNPQPRTTW